MRTSHKLSLALAFGASLLSSGALAEDESVTNECLVDCLRPIVFGHDLPTFPVGDYGVRGGIGEWLNLSVGAESVSIGGYCTTGSFPVTSLALNVDPNNSNIEYITFTGTTKPRIEVEVGGAATTITLAATIPAGQTAAGVDVPTEWALTYGDFTTIGTGSTTLTLGTFGIGPVCY